MSVSVEEIFQAASVRAATVSSETAGYLLLAAADRLSQNPAQVDARGITLAEDGSAHVVTSGAATPEESERALRGVLGLLLSVACTGSVALPRIAAAEARGLPRLIAEIEAALIPVNRAAARRALSRLHRDVVRAREAGKLAAATLPEVHAPAPAPVAAAKVEGRVVLPTPVVEALSVHVPHQEESPSAGHWAVVAAVPSPLPGASTMTEVDATPFLGGWPAIVASTRVARLEPEPEPEDSGKSRSDEPTLPMFRRTGATAPPPERVR